MSTSGKVAGLLSNAGGAGAAQRKSRVVLADDHEELLEEIRHLLAPEFEVVGSVSSGGAMLEEVRNLQPDAVVSDIGMPGVNGIDAGRQLLQSGLCASIIMLTMYNEPQLVQSALRAGILGYVLKVDAGEELSAALRAVIAGDQYLSRGVLANRAG
jgi:DNA-binding NarL/FixJ family response regulator